MRTARIAIVGMGPRGLTAFERLVVNERVRRSGTLDIYYSRAVFCRYLHWCYHYLVALAPSNFNITFLREMVSMDRVDESWMLRTGSGSIWTDFAISSTGHTKVAARNARNPTSTGTLVYEPRDC